MDRSVKLLLTLLVLLGGLSVAPAHARACLGATASIERIEAQHNGGAALVVARGHLESRARALSAVLDSGREGHAAWAKVVTPTIRYGDQSLE